MSLTESQIAALLTRYLGPVPSPENLMPRLSSYLDLLLKWNARTNLTAIRRPEEIVQRHFGESLFTALHLGDPDTLLDLGSGAGFPGLPIALLRPEIRVTLAESQGKKASFLREAVRSLNTTNVEVWAARAESMPESRRFHTVTLRAVDDMAVAIAAAVPRATHQLVVLAGAPPVLSADFHPEPPIPIPNSNSTVVVRAVRYR